jgi:hyperosmotically inducible protein
MSIMDTLPYIGEITGATVMAVTTTVTTIGNLSVASSAAIAGKVNHELVGRAVRGAEPGCEQPLLSELWAGTRFKKEGRLNMKLRTLALSLGMIASTLAFSAQSAMASLRGTQAIEKQVRHELNMLPYVNAFDFMTFTVDDNGNVTLNGQVTNPVLRSDANNVVKRIEGVERVDNQIQVLPVSFFDDGLRVQLFRSIYGYPTLQKYVLGVQKPIRIIVQNGHVTLMGVVDSEMDRNIAGIRANGVPGVFSVDNQLQVVKG